MNLWQKRKKNSHETPPLWKISLEHEQSFQSTPVHVTNICRGYNKKQILWFPVFNLECFHLQGSYGLKRFLRDGYKSVLEDKNRRFYEKRELQVYVTWSTNLSVFCVLKYSLWGLLAGNNIMFHIDGFRYLMGLKVNGHFSSSIWL